MLVSFIRDGIKGPTFPWNARLCMLCILRNLRTEMVEHVELDERMQNLVRAWSM
jgi:hypothetical protein